MSGTVQGEGALIIVPTYNEIENIQLLAQGVFQQVPQAHLLVVDDASPDGTGDVVERLSQEDSRIHLLRRSGKLGLGTAYIAGFRWGMERGYDFLIEMDADFSHNPKYLPDLLTAAQTHDLVIGSRYVAGGGTENWGLMRRIISKGGSLYSRTILGISVRDVTGGFKCFRRQTLEQLDLDGFQSKGFGFQVEMNYKVARKGFKIKEVPIIFPDRTRGDSKMNRKIFFEALINVWKIRLARD